MATAFAWLDGEEATDDEKADAADMLASWNSLGGPSTPPKRRTLSGTLHVEGPHKGELYIAGPSSYTEAVDGDFSDSYRAALEGLLAKDERVRAGHAFKIGIH